MKTILIAASALVMMSGAAWADNDLTVDQENGGNQAYITQLANPYSSTNNNYAYAVQENGNNYLSVSQNSSVSGGGYANNANYSYSYQSGPSNNGQISQYATPGYGGTNYSYLDQEGGYNVALVTQYNGINNSSTVTQKGGGSNTLVSNQH